MKIVHVKEKPKKKFKPFSLRIETEAEFKFLWGLSSAGRDVIKKDSRHFNDDLDLCFFDILDGENDTQGMETY